MGLSRQGTAATFTDAAQGVARRPDRHATGRGRQSRLGQRPKPTTACGVDMKDLLTGKVVLISGGTQGLGAAIARAAAREGAAVVISGRNAERGEKVVAELESPRRDGKFRARRRQRRGAGAGVAWRRRSRGTGGSTAWSTRRV